MNAMRDPETILAAWLDEGPIDLPDATRRAIVTALPTTPQARRGLIAPGRNLAMTAINRTAIAAVLVLVAFGGTIWYVASGPGGPPRPSPSPSPVPTASPLPSPTFPPVPAMTKQFTSALYGYTINYPDDWTAVSADVQFGPYSQQTEQMDQLVPKTTDGLLRIASVRTPEGVADGVDWIWRSYSSCPTACQAAELSDIVIDGYTGLVRKPGEIEAIVFVEDRAYVFTLFPGPNDGIKDVQGYFDAFMATVDIRPEDAVEPAGSPKSS